MDGVGKGVVLLLNDCVMVEVAPAVALAEHVTVSVELDESDPLEVTVVDGEPDGVGVSEPLDEGV